MAQNGMPETVTTTIHADIHRIAKGQMKRARGTYTSGASQFRDLAT
jgi:hypothetical protein